MERFQPGQRVRLVADPECKGEVTYIYFLGESLDSGCNYEVKTPSGTRIYDSFDLEPDETHDPVNHPSHYLNDPSGYECIEITRHRNFNIGNAIKYLWRQGLKDEVGKDKVAKQIEDLKKAVWYINDEIDRITPREV